MRPVWTAGADRFGMCNRHRPAARLPHLAVESSPFPYLSSLLDPPAQPWPHGQVGINDTIINMKPIVVLFAGSLLLVALGCPIFAQDTLVIKPDAACGKDATMVNSPTWDDGSMPHARPNPSSPFLRVEAWTANANGSAEHDWRSVIEFKPLKNIQSAVVNAATLILYAYPGFPHSNGGQAEENTSEVYRIIEYWEEDEVTWLTQPGVDINGVVEIPRNNNYELIEVDVTGMVQTMIDNPELSFGFLIRQKVETPYGSMNFASSDYPDYSRAPELVIVADEIQYGPGFSGDCADCNGVINGPAVFDECGECLDPSNPMFNQSCSEAAIFIPNAFSPNFDGVNDTFQVFKDPAAAAHIKAYTIFDRWGGVVYQRKDLNFGPDAAWWDGKIDGKPAAAGVFVYRIDVELVNGKITTYHGDVSIIR